MERVQAGISFILRRFRPATYMLKRIGWQRDAPGFQIDSKLAPRKLSPCDIELCPFEQNFICRPVLTTLNHSHRLIAHTLLFHLRYICRTAPIHSICNEAVLPIEQACVRQHLRSVVRIPFQQ
ncbi:hypothetical protein D3C75_474850 [compost metagenome]